MSTAAGSNPLYLVAGAPAVGKSSTSREIAERFDRGLHIPVDDLRDMVVEEMDSRHRDGIRYTYTVMNADETQALGCIYFSPNNDRMYGSAVVNSHDGTDLSSIDATISFWVRSSTWEDGFERVLLEAILGWLRDSWSLERPVILTNEALDHQIATIESVGLTRRFDYDRDNDMYTSHAYA